MRSLRLPQPSTPIHSFIGNSPCALVLAAVVLSLAIATYYFSSRISRQLFRDSLVSVARGRISEPVLISLFHLPSSPGFPLSRPRQIWPVPAPLLFRKAPCRPLSPTRRPSPSPVRLRHHDALPSSGRQFGADTPQSPTTSGARTMPESRRSWSACTMRSRRATSCAHSTAVSDGWACSWAHSRWRIADRGPGRQRAPPSRTNTLENSCRYHASRWGRRKWAP